MSRPTRDDDAAQTETDPEQLSEGLQQVRRQVEEELAEVEAHGEEIMRTVAEIRVRGEFDSSAATELQRQLAELNAETSQAREEITLREVIIALWFELKRGIKMAHEPSEAAGHADNDSTRTESDRADSDGQPATEDKENPQSRNGSDPDAETRAEEGSTRSTDPAFQ